MEGQEGLVLEAVVGVGTGGCCLLGGTVGTHCCRALSCPWLPPVGHGDGLGGSAASWHQVRWWASAWALLPGGNMWPQALRLCWGQRRQEGPGPLASGFYGKRPWTQKVKAVC